MHVTFLLSHYIDKIIYCKTSMCNNFIALICDSAAQDRRNQSILLEYNLYLKLNRLVLYH